MKKTIYTLAITLLLLFSAQVWGQKGYQIVESTNHTLCSNTYSTDYEVISFQIWEIYIPGKPNKGFTPGQANKKLTLTLSNGFEFNTNSSTNTVYCTSSTEVTINSFSVTNSSTLVINITTSAKNEFEDVIRFDGFEVRATGPNLDGQITRLYSNSNTEFQIDGSRDNPTSSEPFKYLSSRYPFVYNSCIVTHPFTQNKTDSVSQYSLSKNTDSSTIRKTMVLKLNIKGNGLCGDRNLQSLSFSTNGNNGAGTDSLQNILRAAVYYSKSDNYFGADFFGEYTPANYNAYPDTGFLKQDTAFTIYYDADPGTGMTLLGENNYFWLCYDIAGDAYTDTASNRLDAKLKSFVLNGEIKIPASGNPVGYRVVKPAKFYYSIQSGDWASTKDSIWKIVDDGKWCRCQPNGDGIVVINPGHHIDLSKDRTVDQIEINSGLLDIQSAETEINVNYSINTTGTGSFLFAGDFNIGFDLTLTGTGLGEFHKQGTIGRNLNIGYRTTLDNTSSSTFDLRVKGNLTVYGLLKNSGGQGLQIVMDGKDAKIEGTGTIQASQFTVENGHKIVLDTTDLLLNSRFLIRANSNVENFGEMNIRDEIDGENSITSYWINRPYSVLEYGGLEDMFFKQGAVNGYLDARDDFNTVIYSRIGNNPGASAQNVIRPREAVYYHLTFTGLGNRTFLSDINLHGDLSLNDTVFLIHNSKTITVDGIVMQYMKKINSITTPNPLLYNLTMDNAAADGGLTLQIPVNYIGKLQLNNGKIFTTMTNILTANAGATATTGNDFSFVHGPMKKIGMTPFVFPVGKNKIWARIGMTAPVPGTLTSAFTAEYFDQNHHDTVNVAGNVHHVSRVEFWNLDRNVGSDSVKNVTLFWEKAARSGIGLYKELIVVGYPSAPWVNLGQSVIDSVHPPNGSIGSTTVRSFGAFTFGAGGSRQNNPLPITLLEFDAQLEGKVVDIYWSTATETNNDYFTVEKSLDAVNFQALTTMPGAGNSNQVLNYSAIDETPYNGINYYRLKQTDYDGKFSYSEIVDVIYSNLQEGDFIVYPNPFNASVNFLIAEISDENAAQLSIYNMMGVEVIKTTLNSQFTSVQTDMLPYGVYTYKLSVNEQNIQQGKLIKQ